MWWESKEGILTRVWSSVGSTRQSADLSVGWWILALNSRIQGSISGCWLSIAASKPGSPCSDWALWAWIRIKEIKDHLSQLVGPWGKAWMFWQNFHKLCCGNKPSGSWLQQPHSWFSWSKWKNSMSALELPSPSAVSWPVWVFNPDHQVPPNVRQQEAVWGALLQVILKCAVKVLQQLHCTLGAWVWLGTQSSLPLVTLVTACSPQRELQHQGL